MNRRGRERLSSWCGRGLGVDDYNTWALLGCDGWSYKDVLPYFLKSERSQVKDGEPGFHGTSGPMGTCVAVPGCVHRNLFIEAGGQAGYPINKDYNGSSQYGFGPSQVPVAAPAVDGVPRVLASVPDRRSTRRLGRSRIETKTSIRLRVASAPPPLVPSCAPPWNGRT